MQGVAPGRAVPGRPAVVDADHGVAGVHQGGVQVVPGIEVLSRGAAVRPDDCRVRRTGDRPGPGARRGPDLRGRRRARRSRPRSPPVVPPAGRSGRCSAHRGSGSGTAGGPSSTAGRGSSRQVVPTLHEPCPSESRSPSPRPWHGRTGRADGERRAEHSTAERRRPGTSAAVTSPVRLRGDVILLAGHDVPDARCRVVSTLVPEQDQPRVRRVETDRRPGCVPHREAEPRPPRRTAAPLGRPSAANCPPAQSPPRPETHHRPRRSARQDPRSGRPPLRYRPDRPRRPRTRRRRQPGRR